MGRKAKRARVLARIERLLSSETPAQQSSHVSNSEMQEKLKESKKQEKETKKQVKKVVEEVVSNEPPPVLSEEVKAKPKTKQDKPQIAAKRKTTRKPRGSAKKS